jgi:hypothetical protein
MPTKPKPKPKKPKTTTKAKPTPPGRLQARIGALASRVPIATLEHHGLAHKAHVWGNRWLLAISAELQSQFEPATWSFVLFDSDGNETDRLTFENAVISKTLVAGDELVMLHGKPPAMRVEVFRQTPAGNMERVASRPGDESTHHLWANFEYSVAIGERLLLARHTDQKHLLVYKRAPGFKLTELSSTKIVFGEKMQFIDTVGFSGAAISGDRAILSGPGHKTGYQLISLSNPAKPQVMAMVRTTGFSLAETVHVLEHDRFLAYGGGGLAVVLDYDAANTKLVMSKNIDLGLRYRALHREGDEVLIYDGNIRKPFGIGVKLGTAPEKLGKITLPADDVHMISRIGDRVLFVRAEQSLLFAS